MTLPLHYVNAIKKIQTKTIHKRVFSSGAIFSREESPSQTKDKSDDVSAYTEATEPLPQPHADDTITVETFWPAEVVTACGPLLR